MKSEKITIELSPYYRGLLDMTRTLIHLVRPDLGPPTQSNCVQFLLDAFPVETLLQAALAQRIKYLEEHVHHEPIPASIIENTYSNLAPLWVGAIKNAGGTKPIGGRKRRPVAGGDASGGGEDAAIKPAGGTPKRTPRRM